MHENFEDLSLDLLSVILYSLFSMYLSTVLKTIPLIVHIILSFSPSSPSFSLFITTWQNFSGRNCPIQEDGWFHYKVFAFNQINSKHMAVNKPN